MAKKTITAKEKVKETVKKVTESVAPPINAERVQKFTEYLKIENPDWFKSISYSCNTVIDQYLKRYAPEWKPNKPEYRELVKALAAQDSNFK